MSITLGNLYITRKQIPSNQMICLNRNETLYNLWHWRGKALIRLVALSDTCC